MWSFHFVSPHTNFISKVYKKLYYVTRCPQSPQSCEVPVDCRAASFCSSSLCAPHQSLGNITGHPFKVGDLSRHRPKIPLCLKNMQVLHSIDSDLCTQLSVNINTSFPIFSVTKFTFLPKEVQNQGTFFLANQNMVCHGWFCFTDFYPLINIGDISMLQI